MAENYVTLPLGGGDSEFVEPSAPQAFAPRPPTVPITMASENNQEHTFTVNVTDPIKQGTGYQAYVVYKVGYTTSLEHYASPSSQVSRRFNHFLWLHTQLTEQYPCYFVPALPDKSGISFFSQRFQEDFVESRKIALEQFLRRIVLHPVLSMSKPLQTFFEGEGDSMRLPEEKKPSFFSEIMKEITPKATPPPDQEFDTMKLYIKDFEAQLTEVHTFMERLVRRRKDLGCSMEKLGLTLLSMRSQEQQASSSEAATTSKAFLDLGSCCSQLAISIQQQSNDETRKALMVVDEWLRLVHGAQEALRVRSAAAGTHVALQQELERKQKALAAGTQQGRGNVSELDVSEARRKVDEARQRAELLGQRIREEMASLERMKAMELRTMLCAFVGVQLKYGAQVQESWQRVLPSIIEGVDPSALQI
mmetsp:Transcript_4075/g.6445  ORF Transcript_4075/g.6445 Transcript_4075/m.6445 type:complete len:420 (+) Transcript_4075:77-1336(+)|eukprot:CAMPEP_0184316576 /NCGR_PEP_ID=MMETSP1049-20130417/91009_1 /TAXON_ID=77928 /ORGANISM="Proteomonas sulcata, Strain CCMP704" /LENGTH=419 /DNA_ID=CAMNT_0026635601 /DNA_START=76 /DNA_END=1335 /DNA_ORIENTATION=+